MLLLEEMLLLRLIQRKLWLLLRLLRRHFLISSVLRTVLHVT